MSVREFNIGRTSLHGVWFSEAAGRLVCELDREGTSAVRKVSLRSVERAPAGDANLARANRRPLQLTAVQIALIATSPERNERSVFARSRF